MANSTKDNEPLKTPVVYASSFYPRDSTLIYKGGKLKKLSEDKQANKLLKIATADSSRSLENVALLRKIQFVTFIQNPYSDADLAKMEASVRRNLAVRTALTVREHFAFGKDSKLVIELNPADKLGMSEDEQNKQIESLTKEHLETLKKMEKRDADLDAVRHFKGTFYWQNLMFGRGALLKLYRDDDYTDMKGLTPINTRRLGDPILDVRNDMEFEGVYVDGQPVDRLSLIYGTYQEREITPHTAHFGYSAIEPIMHLAEAHNIATEEDWKEIIKSAWLKSILFRIRTAGLKQSDANTKVQTYIDEIAPGKYIGVNEDVLEAIPLDLDPKYDGLVAIVDSMESKIFKALHVPQFLVQSEDMANRATANKSASLFIDGIIAHDQNWLSELLWRQWYKLMLQEFLKQESDVDDPTSDEPPELPFKVTRRWDKPTVEEFIDLADAVKILVESGVWDLEQGNKALGTQDITPRVVKEKEEKMKQQEEQFKMQKQQTNAQVATASSTKSLYGKAMELIEEKMKRLKQN